VIFYYFKVIRQAKKDVVPVLEQIIKELGQKKNCPAFHIILINKSLNDMQRK